MGLSRGQRIRLSKRMSYILRHKPERYDLVLDSRGFVPLQGLAEALKVRVPQIQEVVAGSDKPRFEVFGDKIRALYGHSQPVHLDLKASQPPEILYHGTTRRSVHSIRKKGLLHKGRQYVHLSQTKEQARQVGKRRDSRPVILTVKAGEAHREGIDFYLSGDVYLVEFLPPQFIVAPVSDEL